MTVSNRIQGALKSFMEQRTHAGTIPATHSSPWLDLGAICRVYWSECRGSLEAMRSGGLPGAAWVSAIESFSTNAASRVRMVEITE